jgi:hypothetical protein
MGQVSFAVLELLPLHHSEDDGVDELVQPPRTRSDGVEERSLVDVADVGGHEGRRHGQPRGEGRRTRGGGEAQEGSARRTSSGGRKSIRGSEMAVRLMGGAGKLRLHSRAVPESVEADHESGSSLQVRSVRCLNLSDVIDETRQRRPYQ